MKVDYGGAVAFIVGRWRLEGRGTASPAQAVERLSTRYPEASGVLKSSAASDGIGVRQWMSAEDDRPSDDADDRAFTLHRSHVNRSSAGAIAHVRLTTGDSSGLTATVSLRPEASTWMMLLAGLIALIVGTAWAAVRLPIALVLVPVGAVVLVGIVLRSARDARQLVADIGDAVGGRLTEAGATPPTRR